MDDSELTPHLDAQGDAGSSNRSAMQSAIGRIWTQVLQCPQPVRLDDNFFELGGDSLAMMIVLFRTAECCRVELPPNILMIQPTLREFCAGVDAARKGHHEL
jgi:Phosphopantetheine attachment site